MRITPLDVRKQEFSKSMRGFDCDEVRAFLNTLADEYEAVLVDNKQIREHSIDQDEKIGEYQKMERNLRDTLMTAERLTQESRETAIREGELIIREAEMKARGVLEECRLRTEELRREIMGLRKEKETYLARFRSLAEAQIQFIDVHRSDFEDLDRRLTDIVDSVVTRTGTAAPVAHGEAKPAAHGAYSAPGTYTAPSGGPSPAASPDRTPSTTSANDVWRDYAPGRAAASNGTNAPAAAAPEGDLNGSVDRTLAEVNTAQYKDHGPQPLPGQHDPDAAKAWSPEPVAVEVTNI